MKRGILPILAIVILISTGYAIDANMYIFAVGSNGEGIPATLEVSVTPGSGQIGITIGDSIVGADTQQSVRNAIMAAAKEANVNWHKYNYLVTIDARAKEIEGPSAGLPMALLFYSIFTHKPLPKYVSGTGEIYPDGTVYPVGGVFEKAQAAHKVGIRIFIIPTQDVNTTAEIPEEIAPGITQTVPQTVNIVKYAKEHWGMTVVPVDTLEQAIAAAYGEKPPAEVNIPTQNQNVLKNFIPPEYNAVQSKAFAEIAENMVKNAESLVSKASDCNSLYLRDKQIANYLTNGLQTAKDQVAVAKKLVNRGYYYTAANYAFLAMINAKMYYLVCEHPSVLDPTSIAFQDYLTSVKSKADHVGTLVSDANVNRANFAWIGGARTRYIRAEDAIKSVENGQATSVGALQQLVSADEWLNSALAMYNVGKKLTGPSLANLGDLAKQSVMAVEDLQEMTDISGDPGVIQRIQWAKEAYLKGWYYAAAMEAAAAEGLAVGNIQAENGDPTQKLSELMAEKFTPHGLWSDLYYGHARYYYEAMQAYLERGQKQQAKDMAKTGLQIYEMAKYIDNIDSQIAAAPTVTITTKREGLSLGNLPAIGKEKVRALAALAAVASALIILLAVSSSGKRKASARQSGANHHDRVRKEHEYHHKIIKLESELRHLEKRAKSGDAEAKKRIAVIKRQIGRYRKLIEKMKEDGKKTGEKASKA